MDKKKVSYLQKEGNHLIECRKEDPLAGDVYAPLRSALTARPLDVQRPYDLRTPKACYPLVGDSDLHQRQQVQDSLASLARHLRLCGVEVGD